MRVLIGGEYSGTIRDAFLAFGHDAWSCDMSPTQSPGPHFQCDWWEVMGDDWDLGIFHPTCTYLANSGAKHLYNGMKKENGINRDRWAKMEQAAHEFKCLKDDKRIKKKVLENPIMHGHARKIIGPANIQIVQPWWFGHKEMKATCLWLDDLPELAATDIVGPPPDDPVEKKKWEKVFRMAPTDDPEVRRMARSKTCAGLAAAMASQWGGAKHRERLRDG